MPSIEAEPQSPPSQSHKKLRLDQRPVRALRILLDLWAVLLAFWLSFLAHSWLETVGILGRQNLEPADYVNLAILFGFICIGVFWKLDLYRERASVLNLSELQDAIKGVLLSAAIFLAVLFLVKAPEFSRFVTIGGFLASAALIVLERRLFSAFVRRVQLKGKISRRNVLIYGCGETGRLLMKKLLQAPYKACRIVGFIDDFAPRGSIIGCRINQTTLETYEAQVLGRLQDLGRIANEHNVDELLVTLSLTNAERHHELIQLARQANVEVGVVPRFGEIRADQLDVEDLSAVTVLRPVSVKPRHLYPTAKRLFDLVVASTLLVISTPVWIFAAIAIRLESGGPVLFRQMRVGEGGRLFRIYKFRTMQNDVDPYQNSPQGESDPRITRVGKILRTGGLDEIPQLINVIKGEMSLVGPRPEMPFIVEKYSALERQRLQVKPGITGIWQLSCDRHAEIHENLEYDLYYIHHRSLLLDALLLVETVFFTVGLITDLSRREALFGARDRRRAAMPVPRVREPETKGYFLVALDQRRVDTLPESWVTCAPAFYTLASHGLVKVLVSPDNVASFDNLLQQGPERGASNRTEYVPYVDRSQLRALTLGAEFVLTDLEHVRNWARDGEVGLLYVNGHAVHWYNPSDSTEAIVANLREQLPIVAAPDAVVEQPVVLPSTAWSHAGFGGP